MNAAWELVVHGAAVDFFASRRLRERAELLDVLRRLTAHPNQRGDATEQDQTSRTLQIKQVGVWRITYWADHAVKELRVVRIERL
ncbi:MAG: hypothetical protein HY360_03055 [Verrucomicrobia bacterium]|nr:hypothetical protein [Verrucomicrobiota bacterium]